MSAPTLIGEIIPDVVDYLQRVEGKRKAAGIPDPEPDTFFLCDNCGVRVYVFRADLPEVKGFPEPAYLCLECQQ
jgi:hypothetical protein